MAYIRRLLSVNSNLLRVCCAELFAIVFLAIVELPEMFEGQALGHFFYLSSGSNKKMKTKRSAPVKVLRGKNRDGKNVVAKFVKQALSAVPWHCWKCDRIDDRA